MDISKLNVKNQNQKVSLKNFDSYKRWFHTNLCISRWDAKQNLAQKTFDALKNKETNLKNLIKFDNAVQKLMPMGESIAYLVSANPNFKNIKRLTKSVYAWIDHVEAILEGEPANILILGFDYEKVKIWKGWRKRDYYESLACPTPDTIYEDALSWYPNLPETKEGEYIRLNVDENSFDIATERELLSPYLFGSGGCVGSAQAIIDEAYEKEGIARWFEEKAKKREIANNKREMEITQKEILKDFSTYKSWFNSNLYISQLDEEGSFIEKTFDALKNKTIDLEKLIDFDSAINSFDERNSLFSKVPFDSASFSKKLINCVSFSKLEEVTERVDDLKREIYLIKKCYQDDSDIFKFDFKEYLKEEGWADTDYYESLACPTPDTIYKDALSWYLKLPEPQYGEYIRLNAYEDGFDITTRNELLNELLLTHSNKMMEFLNPQNQERKAISKNIISY